MTKKGLLVVGATVAATAVIAVVLYLEYRPRPFFVADPKRWPAAPAALAGRTVKILGTSGDPARGVDCAVFDSDFGREAYGLFAETGAFEPGCDLASMGSKDRRSDVFSAVLLRSNDDGLVIVPFTERPLLVAVRTSGLFAARFMDPTERGDGTLSLKPERTFEAEVVTTDGQRAAFAGVELRRRRGTVYVDRRFAVADAEGRVSMRNPFRTEGDDPFGVSQEDRSRPGGSHATTSILPSLSLVGWDPCEEFALALADAESGVTPAGPDRVVVKATRPLKLRAFNLGPAPGVLSLAPAVERGDGRFDTGGSRPRFRFASPGARGESDVEAPQTEVFKVALPESEFVARFHTNAGVFVAESGSRGTPDVVEFKPIGEETVRLFCKEAAGLEAAFAFFATDDARGSLAGATFRIRSRFDEAGVCTLPVSRTPFSEGHDRLTVTAVIAAAGGFPTPEIVLRGDAEVERISVGGDSRVLAPTFVASFSKLRTERPVFVADFVTDSGLPAAGRRVRVTTPFGFRLAADGSEFSSYPKCEAVVPADGRFVIYGSGGCESTGEGSAAYARVHWSAEDAADDEAHRPVVTHTDGVGHVRIVLPKP